MRWLFSAPRIAYTLLVAVTVCLAVALLAEAQDDGTEARRPARGKIDPRAKVCGSIGPDGTEIECDVPPALHIRNQAGTDGAGLCVFASLTHSARWQHVWQLQGLFDYMLTQPGGGWPERVDQVVQTLCSKAGKPVPDYIQVQSRDLALLKLACKTGRLVGVTYSYSPTGRYDGETIQHMVSLPHLDDNWAAVLDNNYPGSFEWMPTDTFLDVATGGQGNFWAVIFLADGPPPPPSNLQR